MNTTALEGGSERAAEWFARREASRPELDQDAERLWRAFNELQGDRPLGMGGAGGLPFVAIDAWARRNDVDGDEFHWLMAGLAVLMDTQLRHENERRDKERATAKR